MQESKSSEIKNITFLLIGFIAIWILNIYFPKSSGMSYTQRMWFLFILIVILLSVYILLKIKNFNKNDIILGILFGLLSGITRPIGGISTCLAYISAKSIFSRSETTIPLIKYNNVKQIIKSAALAVICGGLLGTINVLLASGMKPSLSIKPIWFVTALNPGIFEEISFRFFVFAFSIYMLNGKISSKSENFMCYVLMILPHALIHFPDMVITNGFISTIPGIIMLSLVFGLPLALLHKKRDLLSAMTAHYLIDVIRFCLFGLPT